jgi:hypothetical protein
MRCCPRAGTSLALLVLALPLTSAAPSTPPNERSGHPSPEAGNMTNLRGCVRGGTLTRVMMPGGDRAISPTFGLTGPKAILDRIRSEHDGHSILVTGRLDDANDERTLIRREKKIGKGRVMIGARQGTPQQLGRPQEMPTIEVVEFRHLSNACTK